MENVIILAVLLGLLFWVTRKARANDAPARPKPVVASEMPARPQAPAPPVVSVPGADTLPDDLDGQVLKQLIAAGSDVSKPHVPDFFLYFRTENAAKAVGKILEADGFRVTTKPAVDNDLWLCQANKTLVPNHVTLLALRRWFDLLAAQHDGEYDGWGTPVVRS